MLPRNGRAVSMPNKSTEKSSIIVIPCCGPKSFRAVLYRRVALTGSQDVVCGKHPATEHMSGQTMLLFEERQLFSKQDGPLARNIQPRERMLRRVVLKGFWDQAVELPATPVLKISLTLSKVLDQVKALLMVCKRSFAQ